MRMIDLTGQKRGRWTVLRRAEWQHTSAAWLCRCECGTEKVVSGQALRIGTSKSCGCLMRELSTTRSTRHGCASGGMANPAHRAWSDMKSRCYNPRNNRYYRYGARGIQVCDRWLHSFENFLADMGPRPSPKHSIDRIDNDKDYCPENCKWSTAREQARNRSSCRYLEHNGRRMLISDWAAELGVNRALLTKRLKRGWSVEQTLTTPSLHLTA
jgi:hypothetical protein